MAVKTLEGTIDVLEAAKIRIRNVFDKADRLYLSFSCGKDSLCLSSLVYDLIMQGEIDKSKLTVVFIDEEALYPSMVKNAETWKDKFEKIGVPFRWYCLPFKQVCTLDSLSAEESWITWEPGKEDVWMRQPPPYAIMKSDYLHYAGEMNYQTFGSIALSDGISLIGLRAQESLTRLQTLSTMKFDKDNNHRFYPIYDWKNVDVWYYIKERGLDFPEIYIRLYELGVPKNALRLSAFFGDKTTQGLRHIAETDPELWERIEKRMPNAYLVMLYWDSEMFARQSNNRKALENEPENAVDYKALCKDLLFVDPNKYNLNHDTIKYLPTWRRLYINVEGLARNADYKRMFESLKYGDPKRRAYREILQNTFYYGIRNTCDWRKKI